MAALEELQKMREQMRNPGMSPTSKGAIGDTDDGKDTADARNKRALEILGSDSAMRQPGMTAGRSSVPTGSPAGRLAGDLNTLRSPTQMNRQSAEMGVNPAVADATRRSLFAQQRMREELRGPGKMNPVEYRAHLAAMNQNQQSINANLGAMGGIRDASVAERGQSLQATTALRDRQMAEAGDFDQALLGIDEAMLRGQYGLAGIEAEQNDPVAMAMLNAANAAAGDDPSKSVLMGMANLFGGQGGMAPATEPMATLTTPQGTEIQVPQNVGLTEYARQRGYNSGDTTRLLNDAGYGIDPETGQPAPLTPELREKQREAREQEAAAQEAAAAAERKRRSEALEKRLRGNWAPTVGGM